MPQPRPAHQPRMSETIHDSEISEAANSANSWEGQRRRARRVPRDRSRRFALGLVAVMTTISLLLGWGFSSLSQARPVEHWPVEHLTDRPTFLSQASAEQAEELPRTVDYVPERYQLSQRLYLDNCATCHIGVPPETLPSEAWRNIIQDVSHYGVDIRPPQDPSRGLIWSYLRIFSRQKSNAEERVPYRLGRSRYFAALHPEVNLPANISLESCATCHRAAQQFSFRPWKEGDKSP